MLDLAPTISQASPQKIKLSPQEIQQLSSEYLTQGVFQDHFAIRDLCVQGEEMEALIEMTGFGISETDVGGYHLTAPSIFRFLGQILIIHGQKFFSLGDTKAVEVWVKEHTMKHKSPIRDPRAIVVKGGIRGVRRAQSNPAMIGVEYTFTVNDGAVLGSAKAFFDLTPFPSALAALQIP